MTFDARAIRLLEAGQHITSTDYPGLRLEATASRRTWCYRYRSPIDNALRQVKIGSWPATSVHAAITQWEALRQSREAGRDPAAEAKAARTERRQVAEAKKAKVKPYTVADVANDYWEQHVAMVRKQKGVTEVKRMFDTMLGNTGAVPAIDLTRAQAFDLIRLHGETKPVIAGYLRSELGAAWDYAIDAGRLPEATPNWWRKILRGKLKSRGKKIAGENIGTAKRALSSVETGQLIRWLPNFTQLLDDTLTLYLWTCTRGVEILTMEGRDVDREADGQWWWVIPKEKTKNARYENATDQRVPLFGRALAVVLRRKERYGDSLLFPARRRDGKIVAVEQKTIQSTVWMHQPYSTTRPEDVRPRLPVTHWAPHDLRRTSRTLLAALGCPAEVAESILGHMLPGVVGVYNVHQYDSERVEWLKRLSDHLERLAAEIPAAS
jgi:integrase